MPCVIRTHKAVGGSTTRFADDCRAESPARLVSGAAGWEDEGRVGVSIQQLGVGRRGVGRGGETEP
jgi:hypothetical protein